MTDWVLSLPIVLATSLVLVHVVFCVLALGVLPGNRKPSTAMAWLILILAVPYFGILAFLLFGSTTVGRKRRELQRQVNERVMAVVRDEPSSGVGDVVREETLRGFDRLSSTLGALPLAAGNRVEMLSDYRGVFAEMLAEVDRAESFVHVQFYISAWDEVTSGFFDALLRARSRGVAVRLMFDHLGSRGIPGYKDFVKRLEASDLAWAPMLPIRPLKGQLRRPDLRNHRKILVVDGRVAFTGSQNLIEAGYDKPKNHELGREWVELMMRLEGPVVRQLNVVFATDWFSETGEDLSSTMPDPVVEGQARPDAVEGVGCQVVPSGPGFATENNLRLFNSMIYAARDRLSLTSPYFVPDESLLYAVTTAAQRGVEVELFVSATADQFMVHHAQRSYYQALLEAGVRIWLYPEPFVLHAKHFSVDDWLAVVGSSNMDMRSFALNYEVVVMLTGREIVERLHAVQDTYRSLSAELTLADWKQRGRGAAYVDNVMRLTAALQ
ncbi:MAG: cardiolipin synthase [Nocardioides sp.]